MNMIEKVARAITKEQLKKRMHVDRITEEMINIDWHRHIPEAKAAIEVMLEPTEEMINKAKQLYIQGISKEMDEAFCKTIKEYWRTMIKEALKP